LPLPSTLSALIPRWSPRRLGARGSLLAGLVVFEFFALLAVIAFLLVSAGESDDFRARGALLAERDLPPGWVPVSADTYPFVENSPVIRLLLEEETVAGAFSAYRDPTDSSAVATYVVFRPDDPLALEGEPRAEELTRFALLVSEMERLARQQLHGALPEVSFAVSEVPVPGALRGRSLAPAVGDGVQSDFILFTTGPVLALVVVEQPRGQEPFQPVDELARIVYGRILDELT
jgi:hypothetical protein